jgi:hypothetical protein
MSFLSVTQGHLTRLYLMYCDAGNVFPSGMPLKKCHYGKTKQMHIRMASHARTRTHTHTHTHTHIHSLSAYKHIHIKNVIHTSRVHIGTTPCAQTHYLMHIITYFQVEAPRHPLVCAYTETRQNSMWRTDRIPSSTY